MPLPAAPYTYDDPRLTYDEHCFLYDGGYDSICLVIGFGKHFRGGRSSKTTASYAPRELPPYVDINVKSKLIAVNEQNESRFAENSHFVKGSIEKGNIFAAETALTKKQIAVFAESVQATTHSMGEIKAKPILVLTEQEKKINIGTSLITVRTKTSQGIINEISGSNK